MSMNVKDLLTATAYDNNGDKVGDVNEVFVDDDSGQPTFVDVNHGLFGMGNSLVPLRGHSVEGNTLTLAFAKDRIKGAPDFDVDKPLTPEQQSEIYQHYGIAGAAGGDNYTGGETRQDESASSGASVHEGESGNRTNDTSGEALDPAAGTADSAGSAVAGAGAASAGVAGAGTAGADAAGAAEKDGVPGTTTSEETTSNADSKDTEASDDNTLIRNEEHLNVGTERVEAGEVRLRKYVVTDTETVEVPVTHEEVRVERTPISAEDAEAQAKSGGLDSNSTEDASVTLHEERPVINKETVPVEKVNLRTEEVSDTESVTEQVRKEEIDADGIDELDEQ